LSSCFVGNGLLLEKDNQIYRKWQLIIDTVTDAIFLSFGGKFWET
jgi:hypothetical protein